MGLQELGGASLTLYSQIDLLGLQNSSWGLRRCQMCGGSRLRSGGRISYEVISVAMPAAVCDPVHR